MLVSLQPASLRSLFSRLLMFCRFLRFPFAFQALPTYASICSFVRRPHSPLADGRHFGSRWVAASEGGRFAGGWSASEGGRSAAGGFIGNDDCPPHCRSPLQALALALARTGAHMHAHFRFIYPPRPGLLFDLATTCRASLRKKWAY